MGCSSGCGSGKEQVVTSAPESGITIAPATEWLPFPRNEKPPGGWGIPTLGLSNATSPEHAADLLAGLKLASGKFVDMQEVYTEIVDAYCERPGSVCGRRA